jgi:hypothetical protein
MAFDAADILSLVLLMTWNCLISTSANRKHSIFAQVITSEIILTEIASTISLVFAPGIFDILKAATPPPVTFFKSLPTNAVEKWAIYLLVLEKPGSKPKIYIGSGTNSLSGVSKRLRDYDIHHELPLYVEKALDDGYAIVHRGLLCWTSIPSPALQPKIRVLFIALEATLSYAFWAMRASKYAYLTHICPWAQSALEYEGLCSHCALIEHVVGDHNLTPEQLEAQAARTKENAAIRMHNYHVDQLENNAEAYREQGAQRMAKYVEKHPDRVTKSGKKCKTKAREEKKYYCAVCDLACAKPSELTRHNKSKSHTLKTNAAAQRSSSKLS